MRADRLLSILLVLQVNRRVTARELAAQLEVSERTILRDMDSLSASGVPVVAERGQGGGWALLEEYRTNLTGLNEAELRALFLAHTSPIASALGLQGAAEAARIKLVAANPALAQRDAEYARRSIHVDGAGWHGPAEAVPLLPALHDAIWQQRLIELVYQRSDGELVERLAAPLGLVAKGSLWYLVALVEGEPRTYRVARLRAARLSETSFERPADFDLGAFWAASAAEFKRNLPRLPGQIRLETRALERLRSLRYVAVERTSADREPGWLLADILFEGEDDALSQFLGFGPALEVLAPESLRQRMQAVAAAIAARYEPQPAAHAAKG